MSEGFILEIISNGNSAIHSLDVNVKAEKVRTFTEECKEQNMNPDDVSGFEEIIHTDEGWVRTGNVILPDGKEN